MIVRLYLDHAKVGCGWRQYVATPGTKWVHLVLIATGEHLKITKTEFEIAMRGSGTLGTINPTRARRRLRRNAATFGNETKAVKEALRALR